MKELLILEFTFFVLIFAGILAKRLRIIGADGRKTLTSLVINIVLPCSTVSAFMVEVSDDQLRDCVTIFIISVIIQLFAIAYGKTIYRKSPADRRPSLIFGIICSNAAFLGNPVAEGLYGAEGLILANIYLLPLRIAMWSEGIALFTGNHDRKATAKTVLTHPCVVACFIGFFLMVFRIRLPEPLAMPIEALGRCNTALSMMVIGLILADIHPRELWDPDVAMFTVHRLLILPLILFAALHFLPLPEISKDLAVILLAMPAGATTTMLAAQYGKNEAFAVKLVVFSTLFSIPSIFLWSVICGAR